MSFSVRSHAEWSRQNPSQVKIDQIAFDGVLYSNVWFQISELISFSTQSTGRRRHRLDLPRRELTLSELSVNGISYYDVVVKVSGVLSIEAQGEVSEWQPDDALFPLQWHLHNTGQASPTGVNGIPGEDINVRRAWQYATGAGIRLAVVDDGLDVNHPDLRVIPNESWDFRVGNYGDPSSLVGLHGTATAGLAAARGANGTGVTGVAFDASMVGLNLLGHRSATNDAFAMTFDLTTNDIFINSYGAQDGTGRLQPAGSSWQLATAKGTTQGRSGNGAVYVWAAGNGAPRDRSDYDGQANHPNVIAVAAVDSQGKQASYSESGSNILVAAPGGSYCSGQSLVATDLSGHRGFNNGFGAGLDLPAEPNYTRCMSGTSAAAPLVAGVVALMLEVNPNLTWRDVRWILAHTARKNDPGSAKWEKNGAGMWMHEGYGFGVVDATAAVRTAQQWSTLPAAVRWESTEVRSVFEKQARPEPDRVNESMLLVAAEQELKLEFVELLLQANVSSTETLMVELTSPSGTKRTYMTPKNCTAEQGRTQTGCGAELQNGFRFGSPHWMGETAGGTWTLRLSDTASVHAQDMQLNWKLVIHGTTLTP